MPAKKPKRGAKAPVKKKPKTQPKKKASKKLKPKTQVKKKAVKKAVKKPVKKTIQPKAKVTKKTLKTAPEPKTVVSAEAAKTALRKILIQRREGIVSEAKAEIKKYITGENRQLVETALDDGDWSVIDLSEDVSLRKLGAHRSTLLKIDEALRKLAEDTYGICEECGEEIAPERLKILPFAIYCRDCQERKELMEAVEKEG